MRKILFKPSSVTFFFVIWMVGSACSVAVGHAPEAETGTGLIQYHSESQYSDTSSGSAVFGCSWKY